MRVTTTRKLLICLFGRLPESGIDAKVCDSPGSYQGDFRGVIACQPKDFRDPVSFSETEESLLQLVPANRDNGALMFFRVNVFFTDFRA